MTESPNDRLKRARELAGFKSAAAFANEYDFPESTYRSIENGTRSLTMAAAKQYAPKLGCAWAWLMDGGPVGAPGLSSAPVNPDTKQQAPSPSDRLTHPRPPSNDGSQETFLKVLGMAEGGPDGWSWWNGDQIGEIRRPDNLLGVVGAYAVYITGNSMAPRFEPGELAHIHPHKPVTPGAYVLVQKKPKADGEAPLAVIKQLVKRSGNRVILSQHSPAKEFELKLDEIVSMHRVVGSSEA